MPVTPITPAQIDEVGRLAEITGVAKERTERGDALNALRGLEAACNRRAALLTSEDYVKALDAIPGMGEALRSLDDARRHAREIINNAPTPHLGPRIIEAADCIAVRGAAWALTVEWPDGTETLEHVSDHAARALGYHCDEDEDPSQGFAPRSAGDLARLAEIPPVGSEPSREAVEMMAEHLLEEDCEPGWVWPTHRDDDGYRGGGFVTIAPPDVQAHLRDKAKRVLIRSAQINNRLSLTLMSEARRMGQQDVLSASASPSGSHPSDRTPSGSAPTGFDPSRDQAEDLRHEVSFLLARLCDFEADGINDDNARDWFGHVQPSMERLQALCISPAPAFAAANPSSEAEPTEALVSQLESELGVKGINVVFRRALAMAKKAVADAKLPKGVVGFVSDATVQEIDGLTWKNPAPTAAAPHMPGPGYRVVQASALAGEARREDQP